MATAAAAPSTFFNFGERARENQKAKILAKISTPHKRFDKKVHLLCLLPCIFETKNVVKTRLYRGDRPVVLVSQRFCRVRSSFLVCIQYLLTGWTKAA